MIWDYIIVGAGPTGLTLATYLPGKILVLESSPTIGGCHRVTRVDGVMTEHGPRVYSDVFVNFRKLLKDIGVDFYDLFVPYNFSIRELAGKIPFSAKEIALLFPHFFAKGDYPITDIIGDFSPESKEYIDRLCRMTDGVESSRYQTRKFMNLINQGFLYNFYQPKDANDVGLFAIWRKFLDNRGVQFKQYDVLTVETGSVNGGEFQAKKIILATPLTVSERILHGRELSLDLKYLPHRIVMFYWTKKMKFPKIWGFPHSSWGIIFIPVSDYNSENCSLLSTCITIPEAKYKGKTVAECEKSEIVRYVWEQIAELFVDFGQPDKAILYGEGDTSSIVNGKMSYDTKYRDVYVVGPHNGNCRYDFTTIESAVTNAMHFCEKSTSRGVEIMDILIGIGVLTIVGLSVK